MMVVSQAAPWADNAAQIAWVDQSTLAVDMKNWALMPLWLNTPAYVEFPYCAYLAVPDSISTLCENGYTLIDDGISPASNSQGGSFTIGCMGLTDANRTIPWNDISAHWPAIVYNARQIVSREHSPLRAMAIWLRKQTTNQRLPVYIPPGISVDNLALGNNLSALTLNHHCIDLINTTYQIRQKELHSKGLIKRRMRKLLRDPKQFLKDSKLNRLINSAAVTGR